MSGEDFVSAEQKAQSAFFARTVPRDMVHDGSGYRLKPGQRLLNLAPAIRDAANTEHAQPTTSR